MSRKDDNTMMWMLFIALAFLRRRIEWGTGWRFPMPRIMVAGREYKPVVSSGAGEKRGDDIHRGVDIVYMRRDAKDLIDRFPVGKDTGTRATFAPAVPVLAAKDGVIWSSGVTPTGGSVVIDHGKPFATYYTHMRTLAFPTHAKGVSTATGQPTRVKAGDIIGYVGSSPMDPEGVPHLHFEVWEGGTREHAVDPEQEMKTWPLASWAYNVPER